MGLFNEINSTLGTNLSTKTGSSGVDHFVGEIGNGLKNTAPIALTVGFVALGFKVISDGFKKK